MTGLFWNIQWLPSGLVRIIPALPTATNWLPDQTMPLIFSEVAMLTEFKPIPTLMFNQTVGAAL